MKLLKAILRIQKREHISHVEMAEKLQISRMHWWRIRTGKEPISPAVREKALSNWQQELLPIFLSDNVTYSNTPRSTNLKDSN